MTRYDVDAVRAVLDQVAAEHPDKVDRRPDGGLHPRYIEHGRPACLVAVILTRLGVSKGKLRQLDQEDRRVGESADPLWRRFTRDARGLLHYLQSQNDGAETWSQARRAAFRIHPYLHRRFARPGPWCTDDNAINQEDQ